MQGEKQDINTPGLDFGGFGNKDNKIEKKGKGERRGKPEKKNANVRKVRGKNDQQILLSNMDNDPLNPGKTYDLTERTAVLTQRKEDIDYGIWWLNTQKSYLNNFMEKDKETISFHLFLIKEIILTKELEKKFELEENKSEEISSRNMDLIDLIFGEIAELYINSFDEGSPSESVMKYVEKQKSFCIEDIQEEVGLMPWRIDTSNDDYIKTNFDEGLKKGVKYYIKK